MKKLFSFRFFPDLMEKLRKIAYKNKRSLNAQLELIIENFIENENK